MALALAAVSAARQTKDSASSLLQALQGFEQTLQSFSTKSDSAEALAGEPGRLRHKAAGVTILLDILPPFPRQDTAQLYVLAWLSNEGVLP